MAHSDEGWRLWGFAGEWALLKACSPTRALTWCNDWKPDKAGQQNIQTLFCPPLIAIVVVIQSSNLSDAPHWFVFIPSFFCLSVEQLARPPAYFIQLSRPLDVNLLPVKGAAFSWSPYVELSCIYLIAICPNPRAPTINSLSVSLLILMKCQHNWRLGNPPTMG